MQLLQNGSDGFVALGGVFVLGWSQLQFRDDFINHRQRIYSNGPFT